MADNNYDCAIDHYIQANGNINSPGFEKLKSA